jgi:hypothetical protein
VLQPLPLAAAGGTTLSMQLDGSILASGKNPFPETYTFTTRSQLPTVAAVRLEMLPDPSLPEGGPGRAANGNLTLTEFRVTVGAAEKPEQVRPHRTGRLEEGFLHFDAAEALAKSKLTSLAYLDYFRAMAHQRLGHSEKASTCLRRARAQTENELKEDAKSPEPDHWVRKATLQVLRAEAEAVLGEPAQRHTK